MEPKPQVPPGLLEYLDNVQFKVEVDHGRPEWMEYPAVKKFTNAFIIDEQAGKVHTPFLLAVRPTLMPYH
jgi:hypothetical protein